MANGIEAHFKYGGLIVTCDPEAFARLRDHILAEPSIAESISDSPDWLGVRFISVAPPPKADGSQGPPWPTLIPGIIAGSLLSVAMIVGLVTIAEWLIWLIA